MQSPHKLMLLLLEDASNKCATHTHYLRDYETIIRRYKHEGLSFLTITLPAFLDDFMNCLENGEIRPTHFVGWKKRGCLPVFLQGFTSLVFNAKGQLEHESHKAIHCVRQICSFYKKVKLPCSSSRTNKAFKDYIDIDNTIIENFNNIPEEDLDTFIDISRIVVSTLFPCDINYEKLIPHHGPGSTAEKITGNDKFKPALFPWIARLSRHFDLGNTLFSNEECYHNSNDEVDILGLSKETPVRVIAVPKTQKSPRIIALEPVTMQMCQQTIKDYVVEKIESSDLTSGHINFADQSINQNLALSASSNLMYATLDLSAASDRISKDIIYLMLSVNPQLRDLVFSTRSHTALVMKQKLFLNKFASMGSALCFPMESLFFTILCIQGILKDKQLPCTLNNIRNIIKCVYVYGDDIIIPTKHVASVVNTLTVFGNVVGSNKSFYKGRFRESCGMDAYNGENITPIYMRNMLPTNRRQVDRIVSCIETANLLYKKGFVILAEFIANELTKIVGNLPTIHETSEGLGWHFEKCDNDNIITRFNRRYQRAEVKTLVIGLRRKNNPIDGYHALTKCLLKMEKPSIKHKSTHWQRMQYLYNDMMNVDRLHLVKSPSFGTLTLKRRWIAY